MNTALIFAGGTGQRMNSKSRPKQFLELHGKPIIVYTIEWFQKNKEVDEIVVVCLEEWIKYLEELVNKYSLTKVKQIVKGGNTSQKSIFNGLHGFIGSGSRLECDATLYDSQSKSSCQYDASSRTHREYGHGWCCHDQSRLG